MKCIQVFFLLALTVFTLGVPIPIAAQNNIGFVKSITLNVYPGMSIPFGESGDLFTLGGNGRVAVAFGLTQDPVIYLSTGIDYNLVPLQADASISIVGLGAGAGTSLIFHPRFGFHGFINGGAFIPFFNQSAIESGNALYPFLATGIGLSYLINSNISLGINAVYNNFFGLYNGVGIQIGCSFCLWRLEARRAAVEPGRVPSQLEVQEKVQQPAAHLGIRIQELSIDELYPTLYKSYDQNGVGTILIESQAPAQITDVKVSFFIEQYMDAPRVSEELFTLDPGEQRDVTLFALLNERVLEVTEATEVVAEIILQYEIEGVRYSETHSESVLFVESEAETSSPAGDDKVIFGLSR